MDVREKGLSIRGNTIHIDFSYRGIRCRESTCLKHTKANLKYAVGLRATIEHEIALGVFSYAKYFPNSKNSRLGQTGDNKTIKQALDDFLEDSKRRCSPSTLRDYRSIVEYHLKPNFGHLVIADITASEIKSWLNGLDVSNKRINNILTPLRAILGDAFADGLIDRNPINRIKNLPNRHDEPDPFTPTEREKILSVMPDQTRNIFEFAFWTGLRTSELIALEWGDLDLNRGLVRVRRAYVLKQVKVTKTNSGEREVKLFPPAINALISQKSFTFLEGKQIFHNPRTNARWDNDGQLRKTAWIPALKKAGVIYRYPYQTRHTYASTLLSAGENPLWVAQQMGHKDWGMIRKRYGRWIPEVDTSAGGKVMEFWSQICHRELVND
jgi:integrase